MKQLARFIGQVNKFNPPPQPSYVTLKNMENNQVVDTDAVSQKLMDAGIGQGDEFEVIVQESLEGKIDAVLTKLEPRPLSKERLEEIKAEFKGRWDFGDGI